VKEIRIHGRGGQGSVITAELFAIAAFADGKYSQAFPYFGGERRGAPVQAFVRIDDRPIRVRSKVYNPDYVILQDPSLLGIVDVLQGLGEEGIILINSELTPAEIGLATKARVVTFPATKIALETLGIPITNTAIMGAFSALTGEISIDALKPAIEEKFSGELGEKNLLAATTAYERVRASL